MLTERISLTQLFALILAFNLGSSLVFGIGLEAREDSWLVILLSTFLGVIVAFFYFKIIDMLPDKNLYQILEYCFGRPVAIIISFIYAVYFFYIAARIVRDFSELTSAAILPVTPIEFISLTLTVLLGYILYLGIEVLGRTTEVLTPYSIFFLLLLIIFLYGSRSISLVNIQPVMGRGVGIFIKSMFPYEVARPYGEMVVFMCILPLVRNFKDSRLTYLVSVVSSGLFLTLTSLLITTSLGSNIALRANFPLLSATRLVSIGEFIERIDVISVFMIMLGVLVKSSVFIYGGLKGLEYIFKLPYRYFVMPMIFIISVYSIFISRYFADHVYEGLRVIHYLLSMPLQFMLPILLYFIVLVKTSVQGSSVSK